MDATEKKNRYELLIKQAKALVENESNLIANFANVAAVIHQEFKHHWVGFYLVDAAKREELVLGPFQGPIACTRIKKGKGVCGTAWATRETQVVANVHEFPGHIACSSLSNSEIVVPIFDKYNEVVAVLDIDSVYFSAFDDLDKIYLEKMMLLFNN